jgi:hypothetical protein
MIVGNKFSPQVHSTYPYQQKSRLHPKRIENKTRKTIFFLCLNPVPNAQVCVYLTVHITKLQIQTTFPKPLYIPHFACIHGDPGRWKSCWICCWYWYQNLGGALPSGLGMLFLDSNTCAEHRGYLFLPGFSSLYDAIHGWMTGRTDG